jgi:hypothetical protein
VTFVVRLRVLAPLRGLVLLVGSRPVAGIADDVDAWDAGILRDRRVGKLTARR